MLEAVGSVLTNKYSEGYPRRRYYGGCDRVDVVEDLARSRACELFGCRFANVQPHSGANANLGAYAALVKPGGTDNHLCLVDLSPADATGKDAERLLDKAALTVNKNAIPGEPRRHLSRAASAVLSPAQTNTRPPASCAEGAARPAVILCVCCVPTRCARSWRAWR